MNDFFIDKKYLTFAERDAPGIMTIPRIGKVCFEGKFDLGPETQLVFLGEDDQFFVRSWKDLTLEQQRSCIGQNVIEEFNRTIVGCLIKSESEANT
jgi:hypothetical protein